RCTEPREEARVGRVLREVAVRPAIGERKDPFAAAAGGQRIELRRHEIESLLPARPTELPRSLGPRSDPRISNAAFAVHVLRKASDLRADVTLGQRVDATAADRHDAISLDADLQAAGVRTVERTGTRSDSDVGLGGCFHRSLLPPDSAMVAREGPSLNKP